MDKTAFKYKLLNSWQDYTADDICNIFIELYPKPSTRSNMISLFKTSLKKQDPRPDDEYLAKLKLTSEEYKVLEDAYKDKRDKKAMNVRVLENADEIAYYAQQLMTSNDHRKLWPGLVATSGLRPVDIINVTVDKPRKKHLNPDFWISMGNVAKKKGDNVEVFEHPLLVPRKLWLRGLSIVRDYFENTDNLTNEQYKQRFIRTQASFTTKAFQHLIPAPINHVLFRRFFAKYSYHYFKDDFLPKHITMHGWVSFALMHDSAEQALSYANLEVANAGELDLFKHGRSLVPSSEPIASKKRRREHTVPLM